jgi:hypothetical protein
MFSNAQNKQQNAVMKKSESLTRRWESCVKVGHQQCHHHIMTFIQGHTHLKHQTQAELTVIQNDSQQLVKTHVDGFHFM